MRPIRTIARGLLISLTFLCSGRALADTAVCIGKLTSVGNHAQNGLIVAVGTGNAIRVCSFNAAQFSITADDCKHMASLAATAFATDTSIVFYVDNAPSTDCAAIPGWHVANTRYFAVFK
jgi:hypothetical protein